MFGILLSSANAALGWVFRSIVVKFALYFALYFITTEFIGFVANLVPGPGSINSALSGIGAGVWYFLDVFQLQVGISALVSAYTTRFIIRRLPVIG